MRASNEMDDTQMALSGCVQRTASGLALAACPPVLESMTRVRESSDFAPSPNLSPADGGEGPECSGERLLEKNPPAYAEGLPVAHAGGSIVLMAAMACLLTLCATAMGQVSKELVERNNAAMGLMGQFNYTDAAKIFEELIKEHPDNPQLKVNLAIAILNRQEPGDEERSLQLLEQVLEKHPDDLRARYCKGLLLQRAGRLEEARVQFEHAATADPSDAYACYEYAQSLAADTDAGEKALEWFDRAIADDPYLRSSYYGAWQLLRQQGNSEKAAEYLAMFEKLKNNPKARLFALKYTEMGPKAEVASIGEPTEQTSRPLPDGPVFATAVPLLNGEVQIPWVGGPGVNITSCDINGDGKLDLFLAQAVSLQENSDTKDVSKTAGNAVLFANDAGGYDWRPEHPLAKVTDIQAALWGDYDNDGLVDVYLCRKGPNQLWRQGPDGWTDVTESTGVSGGEADTVDGAMVDADHDGDLDLFLVNADAPNELFNNNRDGTFQPIAKDRQLDDGDRASKSVLFFDFDNDRDLDIFVIHAEPPHSLFLNDRLWEYRAAEGVDALLAEPLLAAVAADIDVDGKPEILSLTGAGLFRWQADDTGVWNKSALKQLDLQIHRDSRLAVADVDGDGALELLASGSDKLAIVSLVEPASVEPPPQTPDGLVFGVTGGLLALSAVVLLLIGGIKRPALLTAAVVCLLIASLLGYRYLGDTALAPASKKPEVVYLQNAIGPAWGLTMSDAAKGPELVTVTTQGHAQRIPAGSGRHRFAAVNLSGMEKEADSMRSNASGIGTHIRARVGDRWTSLLQWRYDSGPGQSLLPAMIGLGGAEEIDFVYLQWPDGLFQSELALKAGQTHRIEETQRQVSSCPVLFVWDGEGYRFVTDVLGVGGMGFLLAPGEYVPSDPTENLLLPADMLQAHNDRYRLKLTEPMEENCYLDSARLVAYDLPPGWEMTLDERMHTHGAEPTGQAIFYRQLLLPHKATNDRGEDITAEVTAADHRAAPVGPLDHRFIGRLQNEHVVTLEFAHPLDGSQAVLIADGWIEYPYSQTMFAAWQAKAEYLPPSLEARTAEGQWQTVLAQFGYPAGMPRQMAVRLPELPPDTTALRLRTNQEIYWDRLAVAFAEPCPEAVRRELPIAAADLQSTGFAQRTTAPQHRPVYDYGQRVPFWDCKNLQGMHTQFGNVIELIAGTDNACAIFGPGEEIHLEFLSEEPPVEAGWTRRHVLEAVGWCKDRDLFTKNGETVTPLPSQGEVSEQAHRLHHRFNTRYLD